MDRMASSLTGSSSTTPRPNDVESEARGADETTDKIANKASAEVDRLSASAHRAVDSVADAASSAAEWASGVPEQVKKVQTQLTESVTSSIRARPIATLAGALVIGYLLGRLGRL